MYKLIVFSLLLAGICAGFSWIIEYPDTAGETGFYTSIAVDSQNMTHIVYEDCYEGVMKHIWQVQYGWLSETVYSGSCSFISMVLDDGDSPHIVFWDNSTNNICYLFKSGSQWEVEIIESAAGSGYSFPRCDIVLDSASSPHVVWYDCVGERLRYACLSQAQWNVSTLDTGISVGGDPSIAIDSQDFLHVSYVKGDPGYVNYAVHDGNNWGIQELSVGGTSYGKTSIALNSMEYPGISYESSQQNESAKYVYFDGQQWQSDLVYGLQYITPGSPNALCISENDVPYISACRWDYQSFIMCLHKEGGIWLTDYPEGSYTGWDNSICLDLSGYIHIAYNNMTNSDLSHATNNVTSTSSQSISPINPFSFSAPVEE